jgi:N-methylhydantoinase A
MDIGGTFTDVVAYDEATGSYVAGKAATTPQDLTQGVFSALDQVIASPAEIGFTVHGTTQGLNAFLQRRGEQVLLLATRGAGDVYHIARGNRLRLYDIHYRKPTPLVPRGPPCPRRGVRGRRRRVSLQLPQSRARIAGWRDSGRGA